MSFSRRNFTARLLLSAALTFAALLSASAASIDSVPPLPAPTGTVVQVSTEAQLQNAVSLAVPFTTIVIAPGTYYLTRTLALNGVNDVTIRGGTNRRDEVVLAGRGMSNANYGAVESGIWTNAQRATIANLTIRDVYGYGVVFAAGAQAPHVYNMHLIDVGQGFIVASPDGVGAGVDNGVLEYSLAEYTMTARTGNTNAVDLHTAKRWVVRHNLFRNLVAPVGQMAGPAVAVWDGASDAIVEGNTFVNCQHEVALGMSERTPHDNTGGIVRNNFITRAAGLSGEAAITVADSPTTQVVHNTVFLAGPMASTLEYRYAGTRGVVIANNLLSGPIQARDGATGTVTSNVVDAPARLFVNAAAGDLHLASTATAVMDAVPVLVTAPTDWDGDPRPSGAAADYGADEYVPVARSVTTQVTTSATTATRSSADAGSAGDSTQTTATTAAVDLPQPWQTQDIGNPSRFGSATYSNGTFTLASAAAGIWGTSDQFRFVFQPLDGDGEIVARVASQDQRKLSAKAGVMIRGALTSDAANAFVSLSSLKGVNFQRRLTTGGSTLVTPGNWKAMDPYWVRLVRAGPNFSAYSSADGRNWRLIGSSAVTMDQRVYVGLAVSSETPSTLATADFTNVSVTGGVQGPTVTLTTPADGASFPAPATLTLNANASAPVNSIANVTFYADTLAIGSASNAPYTVSWKNVPAGKYAIRAVALDNKGNAATSNTASVTVGVTNQPPAVTLTAPTGGSTFTAPAAITISATASDPDSAVASVAFYAGAQLIGSFSASPYTVRWNGVVAGTYVLTAIATDAQGASTTSAPVSVTVTTPNQPPTVSLTSPTSGATYTAPATMAVTAAASDPDGTVASVSFYASAQFIGSVSAAPFSITWNNVAAGAYSLTAVATDNTGASTTSAATAVTVKNPNQPPVVALTSPANGSTYVAPGSMTLTATASDADGSVASVKFYVGSLLLGTVNASPYTLTWSAVAAGSYTLTAVATDNNGASTTSSPVSVSVSSANKPPTVALTAPTAGASYVALTAIALTATASDPDGTIAQVRFYVGAQLVGTSTAAPYMATWSYPAAGNYILTAVAVDNSGAMATSAPVSMSVVAAPLVVELKFSASVDDATVTSYTLNLFRTGTTTPSVGTQNLGKPPVVSGQISVDITPLAQSLPSGTYYGTVTATSIGGSSTSLPSNNFTR